MDQDNTGPSWYYTRDNVLVMVIRSLAHHFLPFPTGGGRGHKCNGPRQHGTNYVIQTTPAQV